MILLVWFIVLQQAFLPGAIAGILFGAILKWPKNVCLVLLILASLASGLIWSQKVNPNVEFHLRVESLLMYCPPIFFSLLLGTILGRIFRWRLKPAP